MSCILIFKIEVNQQGHIYVKVQGSEVQGSGLLVKDMEFGKAVEYSNEMFAALCMTEDAVEVVDAFLNKRKSIWKMK